MLARRFRIGLFSIVIVTIGAAAGCRGYRPVSVQDPYRPRASDPRVPMPADPRPAIRPAPPAELPVPPLPSETPAAPMLIPPPTSLETSPDFPGLIEPERRMLPESRRESTTNLYFKPRLHRRDQTRRDPIVEPVESQRKLVPQDSGLPGLFSRLAAPFRRAADSHGGS